MKKELISKEGQKYFVQDDISALLEGVFIEPEDNISNVYACHSMPVPCHNPCNMSPYARNKPSKFKE